MNAQDHPIVGGGIAADRVVIGIREIDPNGLIGLLREQRDPPCCRPLLSKGLWTGKPRDSIWRNMESKYAGLHLERKIVSLNAKERMARDDQGMKFHGEKILLATGGTPRQIPFDGEGILYYRTLEDYRHLVSVTEAGRDQATDSSACLGLNRWAASMGARSQDRWSWGHPWAVPHKTLLVMRVPSRTASS